MSELKPIPYSRQSIDRDDIDSVLETLTSRWLTTGPMVEKFERLVAEYSQCSHGAAFSSGTAALHGMMNAAGVEPGDEVIVPAITFIATSNAVLYEGGTPVFADVLPDTLLLDPEDVLRKITPNTKAIVAVDYAGQPCDYRRLREIATQHNLLLISDASHSIGATIDGRPAASLADMTCFSFHPVKPITTAEGGMVVCNNRGWDSQLRVFRSHGIDVDFRQRAERADWRYQMQSMGYNYRLSDLQAALGVSQLTKLKSWLEAKVEIAQRYCAAFQSMGQSVQPLHVNSGIGHAYHLFVVRWNSPVGMYDRDWLFRQLRRQSIGVNVHYEPVYRHPYYQQSVPSARQADCPVAEQQIEQIISLPIYAGMTAGDQQRVIGAVRDCLEHTRITRVA